jgi:50S ribosomal subunit-associated GTPase HflX
LSQRIRAFESTPAVFVSALRPDSLGALRSVFKARIREGLRHLRVRMPGGAGETLAMLYREGEVLSQSSDGAFIEVEIRVAQSVAGRLLQVPGVQLTEEVGPDTEV